LISWRRVPRRPLALALGAGALAAFTGSPPESGLDGLARALASATPRDGEEGGVESSAVVAPEDIRWAPSNGVLEDAVFAAKPGEVVGPIASGQGYVVYRVVAQVEAAALGYEEAKERIREQLENEAYFKAEQELRQQLRAKAHVDVRL
jgi:hypothetical protein